MAAVGVTGHRVLTERERIEAGIADALGQIEVAFPGQPLTVISSLAEGADRLVVHQVLARPGARLIVPLPMPVPDYLTDFEEGESKDEFLALLQRAAEVVHLSSSDSRDGAYEAAGVYVLEHCDVLLAVWDGQPAQGQGGTGDIVTIARQRGVPLAWVHAGNRKPGTAEPTSLGSEQGLVTFEHL
jgi:hypothetical protein